jgi:rare lipoprotein A
LSREKCIPRATDCTVEPYKRFDQRLFYQNIGLMAVDRHTKLGLGSHQMMNTRTVIFVAVMCGSFVVSGCGKKVKTAKPPRIGSTETGIASWYGHPYHGRRAANGEVYDMEKLTAAHRTLPFSTWVRVKNLSNDRTVDVRIQDRGPFVGGRIIDLSRAAARELEMVGPGITKVRLTIIEPPRNIQTQVELFGIQVGAFRELSRAEALESEMKTRYGSARLVPRGGNPPVWRVLVGEEDSAEKAESLAATIRSSGQSAFVVRIDDAAR